MSFFLFVLFCVVFWILYIYIYIYIYIDFEPSGLFYHLLEQEKSIGMGGGGGGGGVAAVKLSAHLMSQHLSNSNLKM